MSTLKKHLQRHPFLFAYFMLSALSIGATMLSLYMGLFSKLQIELFTLLFSRLADPFTLIIIIASLVSYNVGEGASTILKLTALSHILIWLKQTYFFLKINFFLLNTHDIPAVLISAAIFFTYYGIIHFLWPIQLGLWILHEQQENIRFKGYRS